MKTSWGKYAFAISTINILLTFSRGAYIAIAVGLLIYIATSNSWRVVYKAIMMIIAFLFSVWLIDIVFSAGIYEIIGTRFINMVEDGGSGRLTIWQNALHTVGRSPVFGIGINSTLDYNDFYYGKAAYVHNSLLEVLTETGIFFGFSIYILFWFVILVTSLKCSLKCSNAKYLFIALISMFVQLNFLSVLYNEALFFHISVIECLQR